jgi:Flp pilus assembly protein protease CpaA
VRPKSLGEWEAIIAFGAWCTLLGALLAVRLLEARQRRMSAELGLKALARATARARVEVARVDQIANDLLEGREIA